MDSGLLQALEVVRHQYLEFGDSFSSGRRQIHGAGGDHAHQVQLGPHDELVTGFGERFGRDQGRVVKKLERSVPGQFRNPPSASPGRLNPAVVSGYSVHFYG